MSAVVQVSERTDKQVAQYCSLDSWLFWTIVLPLNATSSTTPDPLHPEESPDLRELIRRQLTTLSTFGGAVEHLITAVDQMAVNYGNMLAVSIEDCAEKYVGNAHMTT